MFSDSLVQIKVVSTPFPCSVVKLQKMVTLCKCLEINYAYAIAIAANSSDAVKVDLVNLA